MVGTNSLTGVANAASDPAAPLANAKAILLDWDGCASVANQPFPVTIDFLRAYNDRVVIVSNNSTQLPGDIAELLVKAGVEFPVGRVLLAGCEALSAAADLWPGARTLVVGTSRIKAFAHKLGLNLVQKDAEIVVLLRDTRFSYFKLDLIVRALRAGARLIVSNPDTTHPGPDGALVPETGALLAAVAACIDLGGVSMEVIGKPSARLFESACRRLGATPDEAVMIGDNPLTDIAGARAVGMASILVAPGSTLTLRDLLPRTSAPVELAWNEPEPAAKTRAARR